ncbi:hypothetical protein ACIQAL_13095 [Pseudomonas sp. NPDC088368]|uniref:hypothetical protein n=1 Tax=Pseudomonas sp. NPDC088368 TaxID=3364453 RepID=UPI0037F7289B
MSEDREVALELALNAVIQTAHLAGMDVEDLTEFAAELLVTDRNHPRWHLNQAIAEIQETVATMVKPQPGPPG